MCTMMQHKFQAFWLPMFIIIQLSTIKNNVFFYNKKLIIVLSHVEEPMDF